MHNRWHVFVSVGMALGTATSLAADGSPDREISLTIYNKNIALIEHVRPISAPAGRQRIEFAGVSAQIVPETVSFVAPNVQLIEQNFDYDLLTPAKLMEKAVGSQVRLVRVNPATGAETQETAEVLSTVGGVVLRIGNRIEVLREDNLPTRVIFDKVPENLRAQPTLSVLVNAAKPVKEVARLTYLSRGLDWAADYVAVFDEAKNTSSFQGWITLKNSSGTSFANARTQLVAGDVNLAESEQQWWNYYQQRQNSNQRSMGTESSGRQQLGDYYVYPIKQLTTIANNQTKQVSFLDADAVKASKGYEISFYGFQSKSDPESAESRMRFSNSKAGGMGDQLPSGVVRIYMRDARGQPQFVGEDHIGHTSAGSELALKIGDAFDVTVQPTLVATRRITRRKTEYDMSYVVRSARSSASVVTIRQFGLWRENSVIKESIPGRRIDSSSFAWDVPVPASGETVLTFTISNGWYSVRGNSLLVLLLLAGATARAQQIEVVSPQPDSVSVTIYRDLFALVTETRTVDLPEGPVTVSFEGVVETLLPASAVVADTGRPLAERNFDYDALTPNSLLTRSIGKSVTITRTLPGSGKVVQTRATIVAANDAGITLHTDLGNETLHCSGMPERLTFDEIPGELHAKPKLSIQLASGQAGKRTIRLSYLAHGFAWKSAYVARLNRAGNRMDLTAWITLQNLTQASFRGAQVQVVAGKLHLLAEEDRGTSLTGDTDSFYDEQGMNEAREEARQRLQNQLEPKDPTLQLFGGCYALPVPPEREDRHFEEMREIIVTGIRASMMQSMDVKRSVMGYVEAIREELGDYQLYRLPLPTDLNARQTKQVVFLVKPRVKIERFYRFDYDVRWDRSPELSTPESMIAFENRKATGLGEPLPAGQVRVFDAHGDREFFIGEASMSDKPVNLPVELGVSKAMDLGLEIDAAGLDIEELQGLKLRDRADVEVRAFNGKRVPVTLEFRQPVEDNSVTSNSTDLFRRKDGNLVWRLQVPANGTHVLNYRVEWPMIVIDPSH